MHLLEYDQCLLQLYRFVFIPESNGESGSGIWEVFAPSLAHCITTRKALNTDGVIAYVTTFSQYYLIGSLLWVTRRKIFLCRYNHHFIIQKSLDYLC